MSEIEPYFSDAQVAKLLDPAGVRLKPRSIRSEREAGRLIGTRVAGKWLYRQSDVLAFLEAARKCPGKSAAPDGARSPPQEGEIVDRLKRRRPGVV